MSITQGTWERRAWTSHAFTTVGVADESVPTGFRIVAECETEDDARLIAAAPALLEALQDLRGVLQESMRTGGWVPTPIHQSFVLAMMDAGDAIDKAQGGAA